MKTVFDPSTRAALIRRIQALNSSSNPRWGSMTVYQMLKHCSMWEEMLLGRLSYKQSFMGKLFGKIALKDFFKEGEVKRNLPTVPSFKVTDQGDWAAEQQKWIRLLNEHDHQEPAGFLHPFFGKLSADEAGRLAYKHTDHHLKQFGV